jgi:hypothetical protein
MHRRRAFLQLAADSSASASRKYRVAWTARKNANASCTWAVVKAHEIDEDHGDDLPRAPLSESDPLGA